MVFEWLEKVPELLQFTWSELAKVFIGVFFAFFLAYKWVQAIRKATRAQIDAEKHKLTAKLAERDAEYQGKLAEAKAQFHQDLASLHVRLSEEKVELQKNQ